jgi:hypothetical protein
MATTDSPLDPTPLRQARALLAEPSQSEGIGGMAVAAALFAISAVALAVTVVLTPTPWPK